MLKLEEDLMDRVLGSMDKTLPEQAQIFSLLSFDENYEYEDESWIGVPCEKEDYRRNLMDIIQSPDDYGLEINLDRRIEIEMGAELTKIEEKELHHFIFSDWRSLHAVTISDGHRAIYALIEYGFWECSEFMGFFPSYSDALSHLDNLDKYIIDPDPTPCVS